MSMLNTILGIQAAAAQAVNANEIASETEGQLTQLVAYVIGQIPLWITAFIVVVLTFIVARMAKSAVENKMAAEGFEEENKEVAVLASRSANTIVLIVGITIALKIAGIDLTAIIAAGAFGVGFALQDIIMNFIAGVMILSSGHYHIGDVIKVGSTMGKIQEIQTRATIIKAFNGTKIVVPNAQLFKNEVTNFTANPFRRFDLSAGVNYGEDLKRTMEVVMKAASETPGVLASPKPSMAYYEWGPYSINFKVKAWVERGTSWIKVRDQLLKNIDTALKNAGISIPYPIQTIEVTDEEKQLEKLEARKTPQAEQAPTTLEPVPATVATKPTLPSTETVSAPTWLKKSAEEADKPTPQPAPQEAQSQPEPQQPEPQPAPAAQQQAPTEEPKPIPGITPAPPAQPTQPENQQAPPEQQQ